MERVSVLVCFFVCLLFLPLFRSLSPYRLDYVDCEDFLQACNIGDFPTMKVIYEEYEGNPEAQATIINYELTEVVSVAVSFVSTLLMLTLSLSISQSLSPLFHSFFSLCHSLSLYLSLSLASVTFKIAE